jgi:hypothetical protein
MWYCVGDCLLALPSNPDDRGNTFLQNINTTSTRPHGITFLKTTRHSQHYDNILCSASFLTYLPHPVSRLHAKDMKQSSAFSQGLHIHILFGCMSSVCLLAQVR